MSGYNRKAFQINLQGYISRDLKYFEDCRIFMLMGILVTQGVQNYLDLIF